MSTETTDTLMFFKPISKVHMASTFFISSDIFLIKFLISVGTELENKSEWKKTSYTQNFIIASFFIEVPYSLTGLLHLD